MKYFFVLILFLLSNCSGYSIASLTSNIITYSATGKTNTEHVASYVTGKDCRIMSAFKDKSFCKEKESIFAEDINENLDVASLNAEDINENLDVASLNIVENDSNLIVNQIDEGFVVEEKIKIAYVDRILNNIYYGSLTWAEHQLTRGSKISDKMGITENLTEDVNKVFNYFY